MLRRGVLLGVLLTIAGSAVAADRPVVGVAEFRNETAAAWWGGGVGWELSGMLANELASTGDFRVVERSALEHVLVEQDLASSGRMAPETAAELGELAGAQYLIMGTVTAFEHNVQDTGGGVSFKGFSIGGKKDEAYLAIDLRVVDTTTGVIEHVRTVEGRSKGKGIRLGAWRSGFGGSLKNESRTPVGKAIRAALIESVDYLSCVMVYQDGCESEYRDKERRRRDRTKDAIDLD